MNKQKGISLFSLTVALIITSILAAVATTKWESPNRLALGFQAQGLQIVLETARAHALNAHVLTLVTFNADSYELCEAALDYTCTKVIPLPLGYSGTIGSPTVLQYEVRFERFPAYVAFNTQGVPVGGKQTIVMQQSREKATLTVTQQTGFVEVIWNS